MNYRNISEIAAEIRRDWKKVNFAAVPYLQAMQCLNTMQDSYGCDSALSIVSYFLCNAGSWKGETAKRVKAELKAMCAGKPQKTNINLHQIRSKRTFRNSEPAYHPDYTCLWLR